MQNTNVAGKLRHRVLVSCVSRKRERNTNEEAKTEGRTRHEKNNQKYHQSSNQLQFMLTPFSGAKIAGGRTMLGITHRNHKIHQGTGSINGRCSSLSRLWCLRHRCKVDNPVHTHTHIHTRTSSQCLLSPFYQAN
jgi:hypothetical protein